MNNRRIAPVLVLMAALLIGMIGIAPTVPYTAASTEVATTQTTAADVLKDWVDYLDEARPADKIDASLLTYKETGKVPLDVAVDSEGRPSVLIAISNNADIDGLAGLVNVNWKVDFGAATVVSAYVGRTNIGQLENYEGVAAVVSDRLFESRTEGFEVKPDVEMPVESDPDMWMSKDYIGATDVVLDYGYTGDGVIVGVTDTGMDFTHPDLQDAFYYDPNTGYGSSFDTGGYGMVWTGYRINATTVLNTTAWASYSSWNKLSYSDDGGIYFDFEPRLHDRGSLNYLDDWYYETYLAAWWAGTYPNEANMTDFYYDVMRQPLELPDPALTSASYTNLTYYVNGTLNYQIIPWYAHGWLFQQRASPYMKVFAPMLVLNGTTLLVDWNTTRAYTEFWNYNINWGLFDFNETSSWDYFEGLGDWSFVDDWAAGLWYSKDGGLYGKDHLILAHDYNDDTVDDFGLGVVGNTWESTFGTGLVSGVKLGGRMWAITYDTDAHGTFVSGQIAGRGSVAVPVGLNGTYERLYGIANQSKIVGLTAIGVGSHLAADIWEAGFDYNGTSGYFEYNPLSNHTAVVSSNSWGWIMEQDGELQPLYALMYAALSTPGYFSVDYPGILYCFSAGNEGPAQATTTPPNNAMILSVGASTSYHTFVNSYGPDQGYGQVVDFSSRGPLASGYVKPDVIAPGANIHGILPIHGPFFLEQLASIGVSYVSYATYGGTSMACPQVAGVVALIMEADPTLRPDEVKTIIQSTANDMGHDAISQGHGMVDAYGAIAYIAGVEGVVYTTYDSVTNYAAAVADAWDFWMTPYAQGDVFFNDTAMPTDFVDSTLYYGVVDAGDEVPLEFAGIDYTGAAVTASVFSDAYSQHYVADVVWTDIWETYVYNESTSLGHDSLKGGWFELADEMDGTTYANFLSAPYATIHIGSTTTPGTLWGFVFDWSDTDPANGVPDYYNMTTGEGDELTRLTFGGDNYMWKTELSCPTGIGDLFPTSNPIVMLSDNPLNVTNSHNVTVTVITWELVSNAEIAVGDKVGGGLWANLTVPVDAEPGTHEGFLVLASVDGIGTVQLPYSYVVRAVVDTSNGEEVVVADGFGNELNPYEHAAAFEPMNQYYEQSGDRFTFRVSVTNSSAAYLAAKVDWTTTGSDFDFYIVGMNGYELGSSFDAVGIEGSAAAIVEIDGVGDYLIHVVTNSLYYVAPTNFTLTVMCYEEIEEPTMTLSWYARNHAQTVITSGGTASGDHVVLNATWTDVVLPGMPNYVVTATELKVLSGMLFEETGDLVVPSSGYDPFSGVVDLSEFAWSMVPGILSGDNVRVEVDFSNGDCDIMAWWAGTDNTTWSYGNNLLGSAMATGAVPEEGSFIADQDGTLAIGIFDYDGSPGEFYVTVDTRAGLEPAAVEGNTFEIDTYVLGVNGTFQVAVSADTGTNVKLDAEYTGISIYNFFLPHVENVTVTGAAASKTVTWDMWDWNEDDTHTYEVLVSDDEGVSWQLLATGLTSLTHVWDSTGFYIKNYTIQVRATDDYGLEGRAESDVFEAGTEEIPTSTTTPPTTPPITPPTDGTLLWIGLIGGIGVGVVVILILFLVRKK